MTEQMVPGSCRAVEGGLDFHLERFLATLAMAGYVETTQHEKRRLIVRFIRWAGKAGFGGADLDESRVAAFLSRPSRRRWHHGDSERVALRQFLEHLRKAGASPLPCPVVPSSDEVLIRRYLEHLRGDRGLCPRSIEVYEPFARAFVKTQGLPERLDALDAPAVRAQLLDYSRGHSVSSVKLLAAALRSFLRFLFLSGATAADLSAAVPPVRRWRLAALPPFLAAEEVDRAIAAADRSTARGSRAAAVLLLLARLGLRAGEVVALELGDIHWDVGEIVVRGKGRVHDRLPLLDDVGEALALYLRESRGTSSSRRVFLRRCFTGGGLEIRCRWLRNHGRPGNQGQARFARRPWRPLISRASP
jgi:integrase/recombinase XerD